jgi:hypothetical protein
MRDLDRAELRVHGVGRHSSRSLIGAAEPVEGLKSTFRRTDGSNVYAVVWTRLTRTGLGAYNFFLLPFSLLNTAGFMADRADDNARFLRGFVSSMGVTVSSAWILYGVVIFWDLPLIQRGSLVCNVLRGVGILLAAMVLWRIGADLVGRRSRLDEASSHVRRALGIDRPRWVFHYAWVVVTTLVCAWRGSGGSALMLLSYAQLALLVVPGWFAREGGTPSRFMGTDAGFLACALTHCVAYGLAQAVVNVMGGWRGRDFRYPEGVVSGLDEPGIDGVFVIWSTALAVWLLLVITSALVRIVFGVVRRALEATTAEGRQPVPNDLPWSVALRLRWATLVASAPPPRFHISWMGASFIILLYGPHGAFFSHWMGRGPYVHVFILSDLPWRQISIGLAVALIVATAILTGTSAMGRAVFAAAFDVVGFFPRQFHPWAPGSYSDLVVKDTVAAIEYLTGKHPIVTLVGHSQGSVLAYTAVTSLDDEVVSRCRLVTCGSPLARLYTYFFPGWFSSAGFAGTAERMAGSDSRGEPVWWNFYRSTDPIAAPLRVPDSTLIRDVQLGEPAVEAGGRDAKLLMHGGYWDDPVVLSVMRSGARGVR